MCTKKYFSIDIIDFVSNPYSGVTPVTTKILSVVRVGIRVPCTGFYIIYPPPNTNIYSIALMLSAIF